jgi:hypothetical protein
MHTVALQVRRLATEEPEDETFVLRWWADLQFLIVALRRLRRAAGLAASADDEGGRLRAAIERFDRRLPALAVMRNVGEHLDRQVPANVCSIECRKDEEASAEYTPQRGRRD